MKKIITCIVLCLCFADVYAQQDAQYTQYMFNGLALNPAYAGSREAISANLIYRSQWVNMDGSPKTFSASLHSPVGDNNGLGLMIESDKIGVHNRFSAYGSYAYRISVGEESRLALGVQAGVLSYRSDWTQVPSIKDPTDPNFSGEESRLLPNFGLGIYYYTNNFYVGASIPHLLNSSLDVVDALSKYDRHYFLTSGVVLDITENVKIKPSILIKSVPSVSPISADLNLSFYVKEAFSIGASYRIGDALAFLLEYQFKNGLRLGYAYDYNLSALNSYNSGSHEIMVGWDLTGPRPEKILSPRFF